MGITGMVTTVTDVLNQWNEIGVFSYVIPFLLVFAVVFAILEKSKILGENRGIGAIVSAAIGLLSLQFDFVSEFFAVIFPRFGVGIAVFIVLIIVMGFFYEPENPERRGSWIGWVIGIGVAVWALSAWDQWSGTSGFGGWFVTNLWSVIMLGLVVFVIVWAWRSGKPKPAKENKG